MIKGETWDVAVEALLSNKVRAALTMLGVIIGSACIVLVVTISLIGRNYVLAQIEAVGSNIVYAYYPGNRVSRPVEDEISLKDLAAARMLPHVTEVAGSHDYGNSSIIINGQEKPVSLVGVTEGFQHIRNLLILQGRFFDGIDMQTAARACLVTQALAEKIPRPALGSTIRVGELRFTVIGVFRERVATFGQSEISEDSVLIPFSLIRYYKGDNYVRTLYAQADSSQTVPLVTQEVQTMLQSRHRPGIAYSVENLSAILDAAHKISRALMAILLAVGCIAMLISGVGIMNIMLVTVTERTREIGLRKALGARRSEILYQFLIEGLLISGIGAMLGIALVVSTRIVVQPLLPSDIHIPISLLSILVSFVLSCVTGVIFSFLPADRASRLTPMESLRYE